MQSKTKTASAAVAALLMTALPPLEAAAQSLSPMRGKITSFTDAFAVRVMPANPYDHRIRMDVKVYDADFRPIAARIHPSSFMLAGEASRPVNVIIPFEGRDSRRVRICVESIPFARQSTSNVKAQICGRFIGERRR